MKYPFFDKILNLLLPPSCFGCKTEGVFICQNCRPLICKNRYFICPACKRRDVYGRLDKKCRKETGLTRFLGAPLSFEDKIVRKMIHAFKYQRVKDLAKVFAQILIEFLDGNGFVSRNGGNHFRSAQGGDLFNPPIRNNSDSPLKSRKWSPKLLAPVPMNSFKERERGFNQAAEIAKILSAHYNIPLEERLLAKIKNTSTQADVKKKEDRLKNVENAFACKNPELAKGKILILIDDVYTTGATMRDCARALRAAGAREVWGITVAK